MEQPTTFKELSFTELISLEKWLIDHREFLFPRNSYTGEFIRGSIDTDKEGKAYDSIQAKICDVQDQILSKVEDFQKHSFGGDIYDNDL